MSFHGGLLGCSRPAGSGRDATKIHFFDTIDFVAPLVPIGPRPRPMGNFLSAASCGAGIPRCAVGMIFPRALDSLGKSRDELYRMYLDGQLNQEGRHPSQLYEFALEGPCCCSPCSGSIRVPPARYAVSGLFGLLYGLFPFRREFVRGLT
jgi:phosphatidylglycerol:prolipoprotein diacylglycerol transferase